jgi:16S rRNA (cytidine1402-2'-O)-methyltransferase
VVATPIGNAGDISARALQVLAGADAVACEDTRVTAKLLAVHGIRVSLVAYHEHNAERMRPVLLDRLARGEAIAQVSDAGTPLISDPGYKLVRAAIDAGIAVTGIPGPSAPISALVVSGLPTDRFFFVGFLPPRSSARKTALSEIVSVQATLVFLEAKQRVAAALADMAAVLGARPAAVARELTKMFEEVRRGSLAELAEQYAAEDPPLGEITIVVGPPEARTVDAATEGAALDARLHEALAESSLSDAVARVAAELGLPRRSVYARALVLKRNDG